MINRAILLTVVAVFLLVSCNKKECPGTKYLMSISLGNYTATEVEVRLFPKPEFLYGATHYYFSSVSSGGRSTEFNMDEDTTSVWSYNYHMFTAKDTSVSPSYLISRVFDSIYFQIIDSTNTCVKLYPNHTENYTENPFQNDSTWMFLRKQISLSDNDCENPQEIKAYKFYLDPKYISE